VDLNEIYQMTGITPENAKCPRCGDKFIRDFFVICGGCISDMELVNRGEEPEHYK